MAKVHFLVSVTANFAVDSTFEMACGLAVPESATGGTPFTNCAGLLKAKESWACKRCLAALKKGGE